MSTWATYGGVTIDLEAIQAIEPFDFGEGDVYARGAGCRAYLAGQVVVLRFESEQELDVLLNAIGVPSRD